MIPNYRRITIALVGMALLINLMIVGCRNPVGEEQQPGDRGVAPVIERINFYYYDDTDEAYYRTYDFHAGETVYAEIVTIDPDFDIRELTRAVHHVEIGTTAQESTGTAAQTAERMWYYTSFEIAGPVGDGEVTFVLTDAAGNRSAVYTRTVTVY